MLQKCLSKLLEKTTNRQLQTCFSYSGEDLLLISALVLQRVFRFPLTNELQVKCSTSIFITCRFLIKYQKSNGVICSALSAVLVVDNHNLMEKKTFSVHFSWCLPRLRFSQFVSTKIFELWLVGYFSKPRWWRDKTVTGQRA